jgi:acyl carrier protein
MTQVMSNRMNELREVVAEVLEVEEDEITETSHFVDDHDADSLRAIEILARLEKMYKIEIPQTELPRMENLGAVYEVVKQYAGWQD